MAFPNLLQSKFANAFPNISNAGPAARSALANACPALIIPALNIDINCCFTKSNVWVIFLYAASVAPALFAISAI